MAEKAQISMKRERPVSPHLSIYKPQITTFTSITHRATGVFLTLGLFVLVGLLYQLAFPSPCNCIAGFLHTIVGKLALLGWSAALYYHLFNGIRHLFWDAGKGFEVATASRTGVLVIAATIAATALSWVIALGGNL